MYIYNIIWYYIILQLYMYIYIYKTSSDIFGNHTKNINILSE